MKKKGFTLLEILIAITCFFLLLVVIVNIYSKMSRLKYSIQARTNITQDAYTTIEKIDTLLKDYTIDYEEYFNRTHLGCDTPNTGFVRDVGTDGYCNLFSAYGNQNSIQSNPTLHHIYYCSSITPKNESNNDRVFGLITKGSGCIQTGRQSFGQYYWQFRDIKRDADGGGESARDDDDENLMQGPEAIQDNDNVQELYLISQDGNSKILLRRKLIASGDRNQNGSIGDTPSETQYALQLLKLRGFDAGQHHDFDSNHSSGVYDGHIDTRACDYAQGFFCHGSGIAQLYTGYALPLDQDDGRVDISHKNTTISNRKLTVSPDKNPQYALSEPHTQINPYFTISFTNRIYGKSRQKRLGNPNIDDYHITIQTTFNTKKFYTD